MQIFHDRPAEGDWNRAFPAGNGRLGAMVFGDIEEERIALNDDTLYSGGARDRLNPHALPNLERIRSLVFEGKLGEAERVSREALTGLPPIMRNYEPLGDVLISQRYAADAYVESEVQATGVDSTAKSVGPEVRVEDYRRDLDLATACVTTTFQAGATRYRRELVASHPDDVIAMRFSASSPGALDLQFRLERGDVNQYSTRHFDTIGVRPRHCLVLEGRTGSRNGIHFSAGVRVLTQGGRIESLGESLFVHGGDVVLVLITGRTSESVPEPATSVLRELNRPLDWDDLYARHRDDYKQFYDRVSLQLHAAEDLSDLPVDRRLERVQNGASDAGLAVLYFNFGRYLLISSSRPGTRAANLQGIWNQDFSPAWGSKYTVNINIEMNYWPAEVCNLGECHLPLFDMLANVHENGRRTARQMYDCRGFVCHHNTDNTGDTWPTDRNIKASYWPTGGAWLALHIWEHFLFTRDMDFLRERFAILYDAALFFVDFLVEDHRGRLVTCPSVSPENVYQLPNGEAGTLCAGPTMDNSIVRAVTRAASTACELLGKERPREFAEILKRLPPLQIGRHGQLMEWSEDWDELEEGHRHISHLFALHPGAEIDPATMPDLAEAAAVTLRRRLAAGGGHTGWSRAWIINFYARLGDGQKAHENLQALLAKSACPNLLDAHPPFQIDGNFGGTAAVAEMLVQSHHGRVDLLPALPENWASGEVRGLRVRGGAAMDLKWENGRPLSCRLTSVEDTQLRLVWQGTEKTVDVPGGEGVTMTW